jgi:hypothetical protein
MTLIRNKVLKHPDRELIVEQLNNGVSIREVEKMLKDKYPNNKNLWLSTVTIQAFRKKNLNLDGKVLHDIKERREEMLVLQEEQRLQNVSAYYSKINEIADSKLDVARRILELDKVIASRMEYWYNAVADGTKDAAKGDKELRGFIDKQMALLAQYKKFVEGIADKTVDYNVNVTVINDQIIAIRDAIRECISEFEPDIALRFMEKLGNKLKGITCRPELPIKNAPQLKLEDLNSIKVELLDE